MYVIKMNFDKSLVTTIRSTIYKGENNADTLLFLLPTEYEGVNFADCDVLLEYVSPEGNITEEPLILEPDVYKGYYQYHLKVNSEFTACSGENKLSLIIKNEKTGYELYTGSIYVRVYSKMDNEEIPNNKANELEARVDKVEKEKAEKDHTHDSAFFSETPIPLSLMELKKSGLLEFTNNEVEISENVVNNNKISDWTGTIHISGYVEFEIDITGAHTVCVDDKRYYDFASSGRKQTYKGIVKDKICFEPAPTISPTFSFIKLNIYPFVTGFVPENKVIEFEDLKWRHEQVAKETKENTEALTKKSEISHIHEISGVKQNISLVDVFKPNDAAGNSYSVTENSYTNNSSWNGSFYLSVSGYVEFTISGAAGTKFKIDDGAFSEKISTSTPTLSFSGYVEKQIYVATIPSKGTVVFDKFVNVASGFMSAEQASNLNNVIQRIEELSNRISSLETSMINSQEATQ